MSQPHTSRETDIRILDAALQTRCIGYRTPIKFGGRVVVEAEIADVTVDVETRQGARARGYGSMPMSNAWAWPSPAVAGEDTLRALVATATRLVESAPDSGDYGHPLELTHRRSTLYRPSADEVTAGLGLAESMPALAVLLCASPLEAAIHDAYGRIHGQNSFCLLGKSYVNSDLSTYLNDDFRGEYLDQYTLREPRSRLPLYHLVGALDPLQAADVGQPVGDGLPETLAEWIPHNGLTHLKIKLAGDDLEWDVSRVTSVERVAVDAQAKRGCTTWWYSLDFNEKCPNSQYVLDFLARTGELAPAALERVQYIEQPTHRDLRAYPENRMHDVAKIKPVVIDESLVDFESLLLAREQGYSGVALKACKGQTEALLMGAAAQKYEMFLCVQDLTCVGYSFLHSAAIAARMPTVAAIEGNGRQYCPAGNVGWEDRYPDMFRITDGTVGTGLLTEVGLGFSPNADASS
jgi:L-alanine-DL-glutamate epimerase-like enolase superfamily enzyme